MNNFLFPTNMLVAVDVNGNPYTTSLVLAEKFNKNPKDVNKAIRNILGQIEQISIGTLSEICELGGGEESADHRRNFAPMIYHDKAGNGASRQQTMYLINRDGFMLLVMGFTGQEAFEWKLKFIAAFNRMESELKAYHARFENAFRTLRPRLAIVAEHPDLSRTELQQLTGHKSPSSITSSRKRCRELGLLH